MKDSYGSTPLYLLRPSSVFTFAAQTLELATQTLGFRDPSSTSPSTFADDDRYPKTSSSSTRNRKRDEQSGLDVYTLDEVATHDAMDDCWIVLYDKVFDVTKFLQEHPGGEDVIMEHAGRDATIAFRGVGHSLPALQALDNYLVGILPMEERVFTGEGPCQWSTL